jgi:predicted nucleic acid-binding protein
VSGSVDCLVAQLVLEAEGVLLHDDEDFERIRRIRPLATMRGPA